MHDPKDVDRLIQFVTKASVRIDFNSASEVAELRDIMRRFSEPRPRKHWKVPMSSFDDWFEKNMWESKAPRELWKPVLEIAYNAGLERGAEIAPEDPEYMGRSSVEWNYGYKAGVRAKAKAIRAEISK